MAAGYINLATLTGKLPEEMRDLLKVLTYHIVHLK